MKRLLLLLAMIMVGAGFLSPAPAAANTQAGQPVFFSETGHTLGYSFREFFDRQGGLPIFGFPLTEVFIEDGRPVQYFERGRLEWHGNLGLVQAGHLGRWAAARLNDHGALVPTDRAQPGELLFTQTGHTLAEPFRSFWQREGGLATFGYPISQPFEEVSQEHAGPLLVQYFERARLELHPENPPAHRVLLGHLGQQYLRANQIPASLLKPVSPSSLAWDGLVPTRVRVPRVGVDTAIVSAGFSLGQWDVPRHTAVHYWPISGYPGTAGNIILAGHVGYKGEIFNSLPAVKQGDEIIVTVGDHERRYVVRELVTLLPEATWVMQPTPDEQLTLITCVPIGVYTHRLIVRASPVT